MTATAENSTPHTAPVEGLPTAPVRGPVAVRTCEDEQKSALARTPITDLSTMSEDAFEAALKRAEIAKRRIDRILHQTLIEGGHYGNPEVNGRKAFKKPILYQAGAEILENTFRLTIYAVEPDTETTIIPPTLDDKGRTVDPGFVSVTVNRAAYTFDGTRLAATRANCNSREKRFRKFGGDGKWTYDDAREVLNDCIAMAEKRAKVRLIRGALGLTPWLASEEEMEAAREEEQDKPITPWTEEEKSKVYAAAGKKNIGRKTFATLVQDTLGRAQIGTGADVEKLLAAITSWGEEATEDAAPSELPLDDARPAPRNAVAEGR